MGESHLIRAMSFKQREGPHRDKEGAGEIKTSTSLSSSTTGAFPRLNPSRRVRETVRTVEKGSHRAGRRGWRGDGDGERKNI